MSDVTVETVIDWFKESDDEIYDLELGYLSEGDEIDLRTVPEGYALKVVAAATDRDYDSYGNMSLENGFIVFSVTGPDGESENFKLPMGYQSYEGWEVEVDKIVPTAQKEKVVTYWEWV